MTVFDSPVLLLGIGLVAFAYSMVGHGGASGYLALLAILAVPLRQSAVLALVLNLVVASVALMLFHRARHLDWKLVGPFLIGSVPLAFIGGLVKPPGHVHEWVLAAVLAYAGVVMLAAMPRSDRVPAHPVLWVAIGVGCAIGLVSGFVGVGGGIFLSPLLILAGWADAKKAAASSAVLIVLNSAAGLIARGSATFASIEAFWPALAVGLFGALLGSWLGSHRLPPLALRRCLGLVLLVAVLKIFVA